jgi:hypothetical protein
MKLKTKLLYDSKDDVLQIYNNYQCTMNSWKKQKANKIITNKMHLHEKISILCDKVNQK